MRSLLKKVLPPGVRSKLRSLFKPLNAAMTRFGWKIAARSPYLASVYVGLTGRFAHECYTVLQGHRAHLLSDSSMGIEFKLRRNIHRLEKGLIMRPRRKLFAESYISETVAAFIKVHKHSCDGSSTASVANWAHDVLSEYFQVAGSSGVIDEARARFEAHCKDNRLELVNAIPYRRLPPADLPEYRQMLNLAHFRRSVRWYRQEPVPRDMIDKAIDVARYSPSACNRQPFEFRIFDEPQLIAKVGALPPGVIGFVENFPCLAVIIGQQRAFFAERDRHLIYIDGSLAAMSFIYALEVQGLSSCCINWPAIDVLDRKMAQLLQLTPDEVPIMLISIGFPDPQGMVPSSLKKTAEELRRYN